jgi:hypothetical protein
VKQRGSWHSGHLETRLQDKERRLLKGRAGPNHKYATR